MPAKVAKLILPQMTNNNQETIIRIYPDRSAPTQNQSSANYMLSLSYKKLNNDDVSNKLKIGRSACYYGYRPGCCSVCCPGCKCSYFCSATHGITSNLSLKSSIFLSQYIYCPVAILFSLSMRWKQVLSTCCKQIGFPKRPSASILLFLLLLSVASKPWLR